MRQFEVLRISPHWTQFIIDNLLWLLSCLAAFHFADSLSPSYRRLLLFLAFSLLFFLLWKAMEMVRTDYVITGEQVIFRHGVLFHSSDYMELYRIIDYQENRSPLQQLLSLRCLTIFSGDHTLPKLTLKGIRGRKDLLYEIRMRVEHNKRRRGVYEITNRN